MNNTTQQQLANLMPTVNTWANIEGQVAEVNYATAMRNEVLKQAIKTQNAVAMTQNVGTFDRMEQAQSDLTNGIGIQDCPEGMMWTGYGCEPAPLHQICGAGMVYTPNGCMPISDRRILPNPLENPVDNPPASDGCAQGWAKDSRGVCQPINPATKPTQNEVTGAPTKPTAEKPNPTLPTSAKDNRKWWYIGIGVLLLVAAIVFISTNQE